MGSFGIGDSALLYFTMERPTVNVVGGPEVKREEREEWEESKGSLGRKSRRRDDDPLKDTRAERGWNSRKYMYTAPEVCFSCRGSRFPGASRFTLGPSLPD
jgi:hypothetical protein